MVCYKGFWVTLIVLIVLFFFVGITVSSLYNTENTYLEGGFVFQLGEALTATATSLTTNGVPIESATSGYYQVNKEIIYVEPGESASTPTIVRGALGTKPAAHAQNENVIEISNDYINGNLSSFKLYNWFSDIATNFITPGAYIAIAVGLFYVAGEGNGKW
jgi:hypothetical protein